MVQIRAYANAMDGADAPLEVSFLDIQESYSAGWAGKATLATSASAGLSELEVLSLAINSGIGAGAPVAFILTLAGGAPATAGGGTPAPDDSEPVLTTINSLESGTILRVWPSIVNSATPSPVGGTNTGVSVDVAFSDPISYLGPRPVWGAYRNSSLAEIVGGAISLAAGGDGQPTLTPVTPGLPTMTIIDELRASLSNMPYVVATGDPLAGWLDDIQKLLGIRIEMRLGTDGGLEIVLTDQRPSYRDGDVPTGYLPVDGTLDSSVIPFIFASDEDRNNQDAEINEHSLQVAEIKTITNRPTQLSRGIVLDDPLFGSTQRIGALGSVGTIVSGIDISIDEAVRRATAVSYGRYAASMVFKMDTRQPALRPGKVVRFPESFFGIENWQVNWVRHLVDGTEYGNQCDLSGGDYAWLPPATFNHRSPVYVTAIVDGGEEYEEMDSVPRDRLGRIPVTFSFLPRPVGGEGELFNLSDTDEDGRIGLDDFSSEDLADYESRSDFWEGEVAQYSAGELDDPFPGRADEDLSGEELAQRTEMRERREATLRYIAAKRAKDRNTRDRDRDGAVSARDEAISDELAALLAEPGARKRIEEQLAARGSDDEEAAEDNPDDQIPDNLLDEYEAYFLAYTGEGGDPNFDVKYSAYTAQGRWPPRVPVTAIEGMAGGMHGLISAHRQGDICRIAVHNPLSIELVGYQYRSDRQINESLVGAATGMVVDHNQGEAWSGFVFRSAESLEGDDSSS